MGGERLDLDESARPFTLLEVTEAEALDRLCALAAGLLGCRSAALFFNQNGTSRVLATARIWPRHHSGFFSFASVRHGPADRVNVLDASGRSDLQPMAALFGLSAIRVFFRRPVIVEAGYSVSLVLVGEHSSPSLDSRRDRQLTELVNDMRPRVASRLAMLDASGATATSSLLEERRRLSRSKLPTALIDERLSVIAVNAPASRMLELSEADLVGREAQTISFPGADTIIHFMKCALKTKLASPVFEVIVGKGTGSRVVEVNLAPFSVPETGAWYILATARYLRSRDLGARQPVLAEGVTPPDPTFFFLEDSLVPRRTIRTRKGVSYLTLRCWRRPIRRYQIGALKALKRKLPRNVPITVAREMAAEIAALVGKGAFRAVVPMPCGHTREGACLSVEIARELGATLGIPVIHALFSVVAKGSSHPKENVRRPPMGLLRSLTEPVILVDDVATSGAHIEQAVNILKPLCGSVLPVVWIGGDAA